MPPERGRVIVQVMKPKEIMAIATPAMIEAPNEIALWIEGGAVIKHRADAEADADDAEIIDEGIRLDRRS